MGAMRYFFIILLLTPLILAAQEGEAAVTGKVINKETHEPIVNCNVALEDNSLYTVTDNAGKFFLRVPYGVYEITFSFIGFEACKFYPVFLQTMNYRADTMFAAECSMRI